MENLNYLSDIAKKRQQLSSLTKTKSKLLHRKRQKTSLLPRLQAQTLTFPMQLHQLAKSTHCSNDYEIGGSADFWTKTNISKWQD